MIGARIVMNSILVFLNLKRYNNFYTRFYQNLLNYYLVVIVLSVGINNLRL